MTDCIEWHGPKTSNGYGQVYWQGRWSLVHRVVFDLYHGYLPEVVRHNCDNTSCYNVEHLAGGTQKENMKDCIERGRFKRNDGEHNPNSKLNAQDVEAIRRRLADGEKTTSIAKLYGISRNHVWRIRTGRKWRNLEVTK